MTSFGGREFRLQIALECEPRFARRGVPGVEIRASGPNGVFHRIQGVVDSGASRTLLTLQTAELLRLPDLRMDSRMEGAGGKVDFTIMRVQMRLPLLDRPPVTFFIDAGVSRTVGENLFGSDFLRYFCILIRPRTVWYLADERLIEGSATG